VLQSVCICIATNAPWYSGKRHIHKDLGVPIFADQIRSLTQRFDSNLVDVENPLVKQLGRYLRWSSVHPDLLSRETGIDKLDLAKCQNVLALFDYADWGFLCFCTHLYGKCQCIKMGHGPHSSQAWRLHLSDFHCESLLLL